MPGPKPRKRKVKIQSCEKSGLRDKVVKKTFGKERNPIAEGQMININWSQAVNLIDHQRTHKIGNSPMEHRPHTEEPNKSNSNKGRLHHLTYITKTRCRLEKIDMTMGEPNKEAWIRMPITSQNNTTPKMSKTTKTETMQGILVAMFWITGENLMTLLGSAVLPIPNPEVDLIQ